MLTAAEVLSLVRLTELELDQIHKEMESADPEMASEAGEMSIQMDRLAHKLKKMYCDLRPDDSELPTYEEYLSFLKKSNANNVLK